MVKICKKCKKVFENVSIIYTTSGRKKYQCTDGSFFKNSHCAECAKIIHKEYQRKRSGKYGGLKTVYCPNCGKEFNQNTVLQVYCSSVCKKQAFNKRKSIKDKTNK